MSERVLRNFRLADESAILNGSARMTYRQVRVFTDSATALALYQIRSGLVTAKYTEAARVASKTNDWTTASHTCLL